MNIWRVVVREVAAAGRSLRYDLRRPADPAAEPAADPAAEPAADPAADPAAAMDRPTAVLPAVPERPRQSAPPRYEGTGANPPDGAYPEYDAYTRRARRGRTAVAVAVLAAGGAATTYLGVVGGLSALLAGDSRPPGALPGVSVERSPASPQASRSMATGPASAPAATFPPAVATPGTSPGPPAGAPARPPQPPGPTSTRSAPVPTPAPDPVPTCECPRPTPTGSPAPSPSPSSSPSPSPPEPPPPVPSPSRWADAS